MRNKLFSFLLILFLLVGLYLIFGPQKKAEVIERRGAETRESLSFSKLFDGTFLNTFESILSDQMIGRDNMLKIYQKTNNAFLSPFNDYLLKIQKETISIGDGYLINDVFNEDYQEFEDNTKNKAYNFKTISEQYPDISFYIYHPTRIEETGLLDSSTVYSKLVGFEDLFLSELGNNIKYKKLDITSLDDYKNYYYKTDQHWNIRGSYKGYSDIINMIKDDYDIDSPREVISEIVFDYPFYGTYGSKVVQTTECDHLSDYDSLLSAYDVYFGANDFERVFDFKQKEKPNILIFADSYVNPIKDWLASHFNQTVILDMRKQPDDFSLDKYINDYNIDIILVLEFYDSVYFNGYFFIPTN